MLQSKGEWLCGLRGDTPDRQVPRRTDSAALLLLLLSKRIRRHHEKEASDWLFLLCVKDDRDYFSEVILGRSLSARRCVYKPYSTHLEIKLSKNDNN